MKIFIFGPPGSGKSSLALAIGEQLNLPVYHLDHYFFKGPDIHLPADEAMQALQAAIPEENWIVEGNHGAAIDFLVRQAEHVILLEVHPLICVFRVIKRYFQNDPALKKAISPGWKETLSWQFIWFILRLFPRSFPRQKERIKMSCKGIIHSPPNSRKFDIYSLQQKK